MSSTSIKGGFVEPALSRYAQTAEGYTDDDSIAARRGRSLLETLSLVGWPRQVLETLFFLGVIAVSQRRLFGVAEIPGLPHPYWLPVLLASCQYGMRGGMIATAAASVVYFFGLSPPSAAQDFYAYVRMVAVQPAAWLATALVLGGLRNLHMHQYAEMADQLAACRRRAIDLCEGLQRAAAEIDALERRIAVDMSSVAALSRSLSQIDMRDRGAAAMSFGELFRVGAGAGTFTLYLKDGAEYAPVWGVQDDSPQSTKLMERLPSSAIESMIIESARRGIADGAGAGESGAGRFVVGVSSPDVGGKPLAAIVCELQASQDPRQFRRRAEELSRMFGTMLYACPSRSTEARA